MSKPLLKKQNIKDLCYFRLAKERICTIQIVTDLEYIDCTYSFVYEFKINLYFIYFSSEISSFTPSLINLLIIVL